MENNSVGHDIPRPTAQHAIQINEGLDSLEQALCQLIRERHNTIGPANLPNARSIMYICAVIKILRPKLIFEMGRQDIGPCVRLASAMIAVVAGCIECGLLMYVLLGDLPWPIFVACVLMLIILFVFIES